MTKHGNFTDSVNNGKGILYMKWAENFAIFGIYVRILNLKRPLLFSLQEKSSMMSVNH